MNELNSYARDLGIDYLGVVRAEDCDAQAPAGHRIRDWLPCGLCVARCPAWKW